MLGASPESLMIPAAGSIPAAGFKMKRPTVFLDIDGVLVTGGNDTLFNSKCIDALNQILIATHCDVVITSTWRLRTPQDRMMRMMRMMQDAGCKTFPNRLAGYTPDSSTLRESGLFISESRGGEIESWILQNGMPPTFAIIDDMEPAGFGDNLKDYVFQTEFGTGLTETISKKIIAHLQAHRVIATPSFG